jgi:hypothetical protein
MGIVANRRVDRTTTLVIQYKRVAAGSQVDAGKPADSEKRRTSRYQSAEALGEFGVTPSSTALTAMSNMLTFVNANSDVWLGWT